MSLIECYCMLQKSRVTALTVFELLRENQLEGAGGVISPSSLHTQIWNLIKVNNKDPKIMFGILISLLVTLNIFDTFF